MQYTVTLWGLHCWYKAMFEKLGWMILAQRDGYSLKIKEYKEGIVHLKQAIEEKIRTTKDADRKSDLAIMHKNVMSLWAHVNKDFKPKATRGKPRRGGMADLGDGDGMAEVPM